MKAQLAGSVGARLASGHDFAASPPAAAGGDAQRPHLAARAARHRRRRRHERLRRRDRPAARRARRRGRDLHPGHVSGDLPPDRRARARASSCATWPPGPFEGLAKEDLPGQLCAFAAGRHAGRGPARPGLVRPRALALLALRPGRLAGRRALAASRSCTRCTRWPRSRTSQLAEGDTPEPPGRVIGEEQVVEAADRLIANTERRGRASSSTSTTPTRRKVVVVPPGVDLDPSRPATRGRGARAASACRADARRAALRRPDPAAQGSRRPAARGRRAARARDPSDADRLTVAVLGGPSGSGLARPREPRGAGAALGHRATSSASCRRSPQPSSPTGTAPPTSSSCPRTASRSGWSPSRRRRAAPPSSPPRRRPAHGGRDGAPACSSTGTTRGDWTDAVEPCSTTRAPPRPRHGGGRATPQRVRLGGDRRRAARGLPRPARSRTAAAALAARRSRPGAGRRAAVAP